MPDCSSNRPFSAPRSLQNQDSGQLDKQSGAFDGGPQFSHPSSEIVSAQTGRPEHWRRLKWRPDTTFWQPATFRSTQHARRPFSPPQTWEGKVRNQNGKMDFWQPSVFNLILGGSFELVGILQRQKERKEPRFRQQNFVKRRRAAYEQIIATDREPMAIFFLSKKKRKTATRRCYCHYYQSASKNQMHFAISFLNQKKFILRPGNRQLIAENEEVMRC